ncbi:MAG: CynX/NimT family MFS transporter [Xanthobacteraceae bacterium]
MSTDSTAPAPLFKLLLLLWLGGITLRVTILAVPPVIPLIHDDLHLSETQVGLLMGLPLAMFAIAALPGSLLVARYGALRTLIVGMVITALAGSARGGAFSILTLYAATLAMGFGVAVMQPALPALVREWVPQRTVLASAMASNGMLVGATLASIFTIPLVLPLVGGSWRRDLVVWSAPVLLIALVFMLGPKDDGPASASGDVAHRWWPDWKKPLTWILGLTFGSNNSIYFATNAFLPDYLSSQDRADLIGPGLGWLNGAQFLATFILMLAAERLTGRIWPYLVFGLMTIAAIIGIIHSTGPWVVFCAAVVGFATAMTFAVVLSLPPQLSAPGDVHRTAAGMFTISYTIAVIVPTLSGALWDLTGVPWTAFVPLSVCGVVLTVLGMVLSGYKAPAISRASSAP